MKKSSLFAKFTILIVLAAVIIAVASHAALYINFSRMRNNIEIYKGFRRYAEFVVTHIDFNDTVSVRAHLAGMGLNVRYGGETFEWSTSGDVPDFETARKRSDDKPAFWLHNRLVATVRTAGGTFVVQGINPFERLRFPWDIFLIWSIVLTAVFGVTHLIIRQWLKPVRAMQAGVKRISDGDFDIQLPRTTSDELGQLIQSFNTMARQIRNDIKSRDQLIRDISHELRSPLSRMRLALEFVPEGSARQTLKNNIAVLEKMTGSILEEERLDSPFGKINRERFDLMKFINEIASGKSHGTTPVVLDDAGPVAVTADRERLRMALSNVIDNAVNYSKPGGDPVRVTCRQDGRSVLITIRDNGIGIPEADLPFIFEPFYRVDKARRHNSAGYGLGLSLTKKVIDAHDGSISAQSIPEKGTTITIRLPA
ncbi:MAG: HAMP domain-containing histidine kinase [Chitinispirillaceae bacterium]|nr:HAMP domain-containing histidine kinase [Chitinispirillaceae bacterium]